MTHFSFQLRDRIFVKGYGFLFGKTLGRSIGKNISKNLSSKYSQKLIDNAKQPATDALKMAKWKPLVIWLVIPLLTELRKFQKFHQRKIQKQMKKRYFEGDLYLQS